MNDNFDNLNFDDDDFGMDDGFGGMGGDNFGGGFGDQQNNNTGFGNGGDGFGSDDFGSDDFGAMQDGQQNEFGNSLNNMQGGTTEEKKALSKNSIILIAVGVVIVIIVIIVASRLGKKSRDNVIVQNTQTYEQNTANHDANEIMNSGRTNTQPANNSQPTVNITTSTDNGFVWSDITDSEDVEFGQNVDLVFTVTNIRHRARAVDTNNNLVIKTTLQGSLSGMSGTYELDIPYDKGVKLVVGDSFTVHVQLGTYKGKTVVGEISY